MTEFNRSKFEFIRWSIFLVLAASYILVFFHRMAPGVISGELMGAFNITGARLGTLAAMYFLIYAIMQIPSGILADTLGPRFSIVAGNVSAGIGSIVFGLAGSFETACAGRFLVGLGVSIIFISILKNNATWFSERWFALMTGVTLLIGNMGSILATAPLAWLLTIVSWRGLFLWIGIISIFLSIMGFLVVRNRPEDAGFPSLREMEGRKPIVESSQHWLKDLLDVMKVRSLWPGFFIQFGIAGGSFTFMGLWGMPFLRDVYGLDRGHAANFMTVMLLGYAAGGLFCGWLSDHISRRRPVLIATTALNLGTWLMLLYLPWKPGPIGYLLFAFLGFMFTGGVVTFAAAKEVIHPALAGTATSLINIGSFLGTLIMQPLFGWVLDLTWNGTMTGNIRVYSAGNYHTAMLLIIGYAVIGFIGASQVKETYGRNITEEKAG
jgi:sugar phosphate permease